MVHFERNAGDGTATTLACLGRLALALGIAGVLVGCDEPRRLFSGGKTPPDEFAVYARPPLSMPPEFSLRPPAPGSPPLREVNPRARAQRSLGGAPVRQGAGQSSGGFDGASSGLRAILEATGAVDTDPGIRAQVNRESLVLADESRTFADALIFWKEPPDGGSLVDPAKESRRIRENQALGRAITTGVVPTIERKREALFEGVFN